MFTTGALIYTHHLNSQDKLAEIQSQKQQTAAEKIQQAWTGEQTIKGFEKALRNQNIISNAFIADSISTIVICILLVFASQQIMISSNVGKCILLGTVGLQMFFVVAVSILEIYLKCRKSMQPEPTSSAIVT